ncbi:unnamed protein product, partial [marine sediment metagenome]
QLLFNVTGKFVYKYSEKPVTGEEYRVWLYDKDPVTDDKMGEGTLDEEGRFDITCDLSDASSMDLPWEKKPDFYVILLKSGHETFRSIVFKDTITYVESPISARKKGIIVHLSTFEIE